MGAISLAGRERLDNLVFVINCNLQRLDGPVRGNGKIIQELETNFRGAGWNVIKVIWGENWDPLLAADDEGVLRKLMEECVDGEYQTFKANDGAYVREHFFGRYPETKAMVADWTDDEIWALRRGGHDPKKVHAAYHAAVRHTGQPTVILAKTIKGYGMGHGGRGPQHHAPAEGDERGGAARDPRPARDPAHRRAGDRGVLLPAARVEPGAAAPARAAQGARREPSRAPHRGRAAADAAAVRQRARGQRRPRQLDDDGARPHPQHARPRRRARPARRADRPRRVTHVRDGGDVPPARDLLLGRPAVRARGRRRLHVLPRGPARPDPPGGHQRAGRVLVLARRRDRRTRTTARR